MYLPKSLQKLLEKDFSKRGKKMEVKEIEKPNLEQLRKRKRELENQYHEAKRTSSSAELYGIMRAQSINAAALKLEEDRERAASLQMRPHPTSYVDTYY